MPAGLCDCFLLRKSRTPRHNEVKEGDSRSTSGGSPTYQEISESSLPEQPLLDPESEAKRDPFAPSFSPFNSPRMLIQSKEPLKARDHDGEKKNRSMAAQMNSRLSVLPQRDDMECEPNCSILEGSVSPGEATRPSFEEVVGWSQSMDILLSSRPGVSAFRAFLRTEYSEENLDFWLACEKYRSTSLAAVDLEARKLFAEFIGVQAPKEINLDSRTRAAILTSLSQPTVCSFDTAQKRVYSLMEKDSYPRFLRADLYLNLLGGKNGEETSACGLSTHINGGLTKDTTISLKEHAISSLAKLDQRS
ncbi:regulator of G-protein signaling 8-like isoform X2 [Ambystoma mexicanum]|uniref:regulator of G-protein signaling 8-like isoform X2 n=1 Tax=Ambystoma mexicanum TaxID=8296 RepID=UPI0037E880DF